MNKNLSDLSIYIKILQDLKESQCTRANDVTRLKICGWIESSLKILKNEYQENVEAWDKRGLLKDKF